MTTQRIKEKLLRGFEEATVGAQGWTRWPLNAPRHLPLPVTAASWGSSGPWSPSAPSAASGVSGDTGFTAFAAAPSALVLRISVWRRRPAPTGSCEGPSRTLPTLASEQELAVLLPRGLWGPQHVLAPTLSEPWGSRQHSKPPIWPTPKKRGAESGEQAVSRACGAPSAAALSTLSRAPRLSLRRGEREGGRGNDAIPGTETTSVETQFSSVAQSCPTPWTTARQASLPITNSESTQTHAHWVCDANQPSHSLSSPSPPALNLSQHRGLFKWVSSLHQAAKVLEFQLQHQIWQRTPRTDLL